MLVWTGWKSDDLFPVASITTKPAEGFYAFSYSFRWNFAFTAECFNQGWIQDDFLGGWFSDRSRFADKTDRMTKQKHGHALENSVKSGAGGGMHPRHPPTCIRPWLQPLWSIVQQSLDCRILAWWSRCNKMSFDALARFVRFSCSNSDTFSTFPRISLNTCCK